MIERRSILKKLAFIIVFLALITFGALKFYWYQAIWWFDMPMHFLGGVVALLLSVYLLYSWISSKTFLKRFIIAIIAVLIIGVCWEIFEYIFNNIIAGIQFDLLDTLSDIFFDTLGAIAGFFLCYNKKYGK